MNVEFLDLLALLVLPDPVVPLVPLVLDLLARLAHPDPLDLEDSLALLVPKALLEEVTPVRVKTNVKTAMANVPNTA